MPRRFSGDRLILATHNPGKLAEIEALLSPLGIDVVSCGKLGLPVPVEDGDTFVANATLKAKAAVEATGLPALADDSGIEAFGIDRRPGVYSADWAGADGDFKPAMARICDELRSRFGSFEDADKRARFVATLCLAWPDGHLEFTEGEVLGHLVEPPRGQGGFGYDPMFVPEGRSETFGEMPPEEKRKLSHRARAMDALLERCFS